MPQEKHPLTHLLKNIERLPLGIQRLGEELVLEVRTIIPSLQNVWVHGSCAFGDYIPNSSDLDLLFVTNSEITPSQRFSLSKLFCEYSHPSTVPIEVSFVTDVACREAKHPCPYEFAFGEDIRSRVMERIETAQHTRELPPHTQGDPDLAAHFVVTRKVGFTLLGEEPQDVLGAQWEPYFQDAVDRELAWGRKILEKKPHYLPLNLARRAAWISERKVLSKLQGAAWAYERVSPTCQNVLTMAARMQKGERLSICQEEWLEALNELEKLH